MENQQSGVACYLCINLGFTIFYIVALAENPGVSEVGCAKVMYYTFIITVASGLLSLCTAFLKKDKVATELNDISVPEMCFTCVFSVGVIVNCSLLLDQVLNISQECEEQVEVFNLFWVAAQMQAYLFLSAMGLIALAFFCVGFCAIVAK